MKYSTNYKYYYKPKTEVIYKCFGLLVRFLSLLLPSLRFRVLFKEVTKVYIGIVETCRKLLKTPEGLSSICRGGTTWYPHEQQRVRAGYCVGLESPFPSGYPGSKAQRFMPLA